MLPKDTICNQHIGRFRHSLQICPTTFLSVKPLSAPSPSPTLFLFDFIQTLTYNQKGVLLHPQFISFLIFRYQTEWAFIELKKKKLNIVILVVIADSKVEVYWQRSVVYFDLEFKLLQ